MPRNVAMHQRAGRDHLGVQPRARGHLTEEKPAMPVRHVHHRRDADPMPGFHLLAILREPMKAKYSRAEPSPRYRRLIEQYRQMHEHGDQRLGIPSDQTFAGQSLPEQAPRIRQLIRRTGSRSILDYGAGKGMQYDLRRIVDDDGIDYPDIRSYWGVEEIRCYDPGYPQFAQLPVGSFDGVICTDVLEHCPEDDMPWILGELFAFARRFVYANVACFPAR